MRTFSWRASILSKRQRSTDVAASEKSAKFTPLPSHVEPNGYGKPSQVFTEVISAPRSYRIWNTLAIIKVRPFSRNPSLLHSAARATSHPWGVRRAGDPARMDVTQAWKPISPDLQDARVTPSGHCMFGQLGTGDALKIQT